MISIYEDDTLEIPVLVNNPDGTPADFTGATAHFNLQLPGVLITEATAGVTITPTSGQILVKFSDALSKTVPAGYHYFSVGVTWSTGKTDTFFKLPLQVLKGVKP